MLNAMKPNIRRRENTCIIGTPMQREAPIFSPPTWPNAALIHYIDSLHAAMKTVKAKHPLSINGIKHAQRGRKW